MAPKLKPMPTSSHLFGRKSIETYHKRLIEQSNQLYNELLENKIIPEIQRESEEELSVQELSQIVDTKSKKSSQNMMKTFSHLLMQKNENR